jgi:hypothetical protein
MLVMGIAVGVALAVGFLAGFTTFRRSLMWCRDCGRTLQCLNCLRVAQHSNEAMRR